MAPSLLRRRLGALRWPRGRAARVGLWAAAVLVGAAAVGEAMWWPLLRGPAEGLLSRALHREVTLGPEAGVRFLGPVRIRGDWATVGGPQPPVPYPEVRHAPARPDFAQLRDLHVQIPWSTLWRAWRGSREPLALDVLQVASLELSLVRHPDGRVNWQFGERAGDPGDPAAERPLPVVKRMAIRQARIWLDDGPLRLALDIALETREGTQAEGGVAGLQAQASGEWRGQPVRATLRSSGVLPLVGALEGTQPVPLRIDLQVARTQLWIDGRASELLRLGGLDARFGIAGPNLAAAGEPLELTLPTTPPYRMEGRLRRDGTAWLADVAHLETGRTRLDGSFRFEPGEPRGRLSGRLGGRVLVLHDLAPAIGNPAPGQDGPRPPRGRVLPVREFDLPSLAAMDADVAVQIGRADLGTPLLDALEPLAGRIVLEDRVLAIRDLVARTSKGQVSGSLQLDARQPPPRWSADLRWSGIRLERFVNVRNERAQGGAPAHWVSGIFGGRAKVQGSGRSVAGLLGTLDGTTEMWVREGRVSNLALEAAGLDVAQGLGLLVSGDKPLAVECAAARLQARNGVVRPEVALVETGDTLLQLRGQVSLAEERLDLSLLATPHDFSPLALRSPVQIQGTLADPEVKLDAGRIGLKAAAAVALGAAVAPAAALLALIDFGEEENRAVCVRALSRLQSPGAPPASGGKGAAPTGR